jgi:hypothetical protein
VPDHTTLYRFLRRLDEAVLEQLLSAAVQQLVPQPSPPAMVAVDATGLTPGAVSTFFVKRVKDREAGFTWRHWLKWTMVVDVERRVILAQTARRGPTNDCAVLRPLVSAANQRVPTGWSWPMPSSTVSAPISIFASSCRLTASSPPSGVGRLGGFKACGPRCVRSFPRPCIVGVR